MRVLAISGSPIRDGNTETALRTILDGAQARGATTGFIRLYELRIEPCDACGACVSSGRCVIEDAATPILEEIEAADGLVFGSPVYWNAVSGPMKHLIDRTYYAAHAKQLAGKRFAVVLVQHSSGADDALGTFRCFADEQRCTMLEPVVVNTADRQGVVAGDRGLLQRLRALGERLASQAAS